MSLSLIDIAGQPKRREPFDPADPLHRLAGAFLGYGASIGEQSESVKVKLDHGVGKDSLLREDLQLF